MPGMMTHPAPMAEYFLTCNVPWFEITLMPGWSRCGAVRFVWGGKFFVE